MAYAALKDDFNLKESCAKENIAASAGRYVMYKVGPILTLNHGMGMASLSIALHEVVKLLHYARASGISNFQVYVPNFELQRDQALSCGRL